MNHREVGVHTKSFASGLRGALREDPDIILVGEMRDLETIELAITAAATGHLVFGTLHTQSAAKTVDRIIDVFPADQQNKIRQTLSEALKGVVAQTLFKRIDKKGRVAAFEILVFNTAVANLVREGKTHQIQGMIQVGKKPGNQQLDDHIMEHVRMKRITPEDAYDKSLDKKKFRPLLAHPPEEDDDIVTFYAATRTGSDFDDDAGVAAGSFRLVLHGGPPAAGRGLRRTQAGRARSAD